MRPTRLFAAIAATWTALASPAAFGYDLLQAWRDAQLNDAPLASARAALEATGERVPQARAGLLPALNATASSLRNHVETSTTSFTTGLPVETQRSFTNTLFGLSLTQPLLRLQNWVALEQSRLGVAQAEAAFGAAMLDLMLRVSQAYFDVLAAQDTLATIRAQKRAIAEQLESAKRSFEVGTATITDQQEAQARFDLATAQELAAENDLNVRRSALQILVGKPVGELKTLPRGVELASPLPPTDRDWVEAARQGNFNVQQFAVAGEIARREIQRARFANYPNLDLVGSLNRQNSASSLGGQLIPFQSTSAAIGVQLSVPLYAGGALSARERETVALLGRAQADLENARRQAELAARQAYLGVASGLAQVRALEAGERSSQLALDSNLLGYQVGVRINIDVLNAQQQLSTTRQNLARARYDTLLNGLRLKSAVGNLEPEDLARVNALLADAQPEPPLSLQPAPGGTLLQGGPVRAGQGGDVPAAAGAGRGGAGAGAGTGVGGAGAAGTLPKDPPGTLPGDMRRGPRQRGGPVTKP